MERFVALDHPQAPVDGELKVGVPGRVVLDAERRRLTEMIEEKEETLGDISRGVQVDGRPVIRPARGHSWFPNPPPPEMLHLRRQTGTKRISDPEDAVSA